MPLNMNHTDSRLKQYIVTVQAFSGHARTRTESCIITVELVGINRLVPLYGTKFVCDPGAGASPE